ncbi:MAG: hypothetical protein JXA89_13055 [Anaerolineae bacterium]|nr:hypothetical protein [Anaerolineae bacterium]
MIEIPIESAIGYVGVFLLIVGIFLFLAGSNILKIEKISVTPGKKTWQLGIALAVLGVAALVVDQVKGSSPVSTVSQPPAATPTATWTPIPKSEFTFDFEGGVPNGRKAWVQGDGKTIKDLVVTNEISYSGAYALKIDVEKLSGSQGATIYREQVTPTEVFSAYLRLPDDAPRDVEIRVQLAAALGRFEESPSLTLSPDKWQLLEWDVTPHHYAGGSGVNVFIELYTTGKDYTGSIYIDDVRIN